MKAIKIESSFISYNSSILKSCFKSYQYKGIMILLLFIYLIFTIIKIKFKQIKPHLSKLVSENFFIIDSNNLDEIKSHMYGFSVSTKGILTNNYYRKIGHYEEPEPQGVYIMIRKIGDKIILNQDFCGSFGIYIYESKNKEYFALSNSFLLLEEYLVGKQNFTLNKYFADNLVNNKRKIVLFSLLIIFR